MLHHDLEVVLVADAADRLSKLLVGVLGDDDGDDFVLPQVFL